MEHDGPQSHGSCPQCILHIYHQQWSCHRQYNEHPLLVPLESVSQVRQLKELPMCHLFLLTGTAKHTLKNTGILCSTFIWCVIWTFLFHRELKICYTQSSNKFQDLSLPKKILPCKNYVAKVDSSRNSCFHRNQRFITTLQEHFHWTIT